MTTRVDLIAELEADGMSVVEWTDDAGTDYPEHAHRRDEVIIVLAGEISMTVRGREHRLGPGDRLELGAGELHTANVGPSGATYLVGRR